MILGSFNGRHGTLLAGLSLELSRWNGKGFTSLRAIGQRADEVTTFVAEYAPSRVDQRHVRGWQRDGDTVQVWGRKRQTCAVICDALRAYSAELADKEPGVEYPAIELMRPPGGKVSATPQIPDNVGPQD